jgi:hypothetical protein
VQEPQTASKASPEALQVQMMFEGRVCRFVLDWFLLLGATFEVKQFEVSSKCARFALQSCSLNDVRKFRCDGSTM